MVPSVLCFLFCNLCLLTGYIGWRIQEGSAPALDSNLFIFIRFYGNKTVLLRDRKRRTGPRPPPTSKSFPKCLSIFCPKFCPFFVQNVCPIFCPKFCPFFVQHFCPNLFLGEPPPQLGGGGYPRGRPPSWGYPCWHPPPVVQIYFGGYPQGRLTPAPQLGEGTPGGTPPVGGVPLGAPQLGGTPGGAPPPPSWGVPLGAPL